MAVNPQYARTLIGQQVVVHSHYGVHNGILHEVRGDGVVLRNVSRMSTVSGNGKQEDVQHADGAQEADAEQVFFWPFFFLPWFALWALGPWWWW